MPRVANDAVLWFLGELTSRIVAESGIPSDRYHMGKIILQSLKDAPDFLMQIDGARDDKETNKSALERTVRCAYAMKAAGLKIGDVVALMAPNHIDLAIPFYAGRDSAVFCLQLVFVISDDLRIAFNVNKPRMVFCQSEKAPVVQSVVNELKLDTLIVTFDKSDDFCSFNEFLERGMDGPSVEEFRPTDFDPEKTVALLICTSGTTGLPKSAVVVHKNLAITAPYMFSRFNDFPTPTQMSLVVSPLIWLSAILNYVRGDSGTRGVHAGIEGRGVLDPAPPAIASRARSAARPAVPCKLSVHMPATSLLYKNGCRITHRAYERAIL
ncbi:unnamed protein product [Diatraea saccharalis]|uniref:Long-chain-fatty-acid--CoA ligase n=1 Tax=Diatraea saccharalis TaxID=40085 RepID=A0A9N9R722_9NEOP|nr:unnamed protein product [Diatraea saccharalis]